MRKPNTKATENAFSGLALAKPAAAPWPVAATPAPEPTPAVRPQSTPVSVAKFGLTRAVRQKKPRDDDELCQLAIRLTRGERTQLQDIARSLNLDVQGMVTLAVNDYIKARLGRQ